MTRRQTILRIRRQQDNDCHRWAGSRFQSPGEEVKQAEHILLAGACGAGQES